MRKRKIRDVVEKKTTNGERQRENLEWVKTGGRA